MPGFDLQYTAICRLMIRSLYLFEDMGRLDSIKVAQLYGGASAVIRGMIFYEEKEFYLLASTTYIFQSLYLASCTLLRFLKTSFSRHVDTSGGSSLFLSSVSLLQKMSIANDDGPAKAATVLSLLWRSERVFKRADGSERLELRIRSRSAMSLIFDCLLWCREEFLQPTASGDERKADEASRLLALADVGRGAHKPRGSSARVERDCCRPVDRS